MEEKSDIFTTENLSAFILWNIADWCNKPLMQTICICGIIVITITSITYYIKMLKQNNKQLQIKAIKAITHQLIFSVIFITMHIIKYPTVFIGN